VAKDSRKNSKKVNDQKKIIKRTREDKLASALKKNIKLRKENKNNC
jgi:hypothetical protein